MCRYLKIKAITHMPLERESKKTNGLIWQNLPKERDCRTLTTIEEIVIINYLNLCTRLCLNFRTPFEVFFGHQFDAISG